MPWKETGAMKERMKFFVEYEQGEYSMSELCRRYGISRPTGYKWVERVDQYGLRGLEDRSRAPKHHAHAIRDQMVEMIVQARAKHPTWGPKKLKVWLSEKHKREDFPCASTIGSIIKRSGMSVARRRRRRATPSTHPFAECDCPNAVWSADFKGWFMTGDGERCEPLTISDSYSRYLIRCQAMKGISLERVQSLFEASFREYGMPVVIRTDNGSPFASRGLGGLSRLSVWLIKLGITPERISPGKPQENGRHERMHLTLKKETASPPQKNLRRQQEVFDRFRVEYNEERPHEALGMSTPAMCYEPSCRRYPGRVGPVVYQEGMILRRVQKRGEINWNGQRVFIGEAFSGERIGFSGLDEDIYSVYMGHVQIGIFDSRRLRVTGTTGPRKS